MEQSAREGLRHTAHTINLKTRLIFTMENAWGINCGCAFVVRSRCRENFQNVGEQCSKLVSQIFHVLIKTMSKFCFYHHDNSHARSLTCRVFAISVPTLITIIMSSLNEHFYQNLDPFGSCYINFSWYATQNSLLL